MVRTGHQPRAAAGRRLWRCADNIARYATNVLLFAAVLTAALAA